MTRHLCCTIATSDDCDIILEYVDALHFALALAKAAKVLHISGATMAGVTTDICLVFTGVSARREDYQLSSGGAPGAMSPRNESCPAVCCSNWSGAEVR